MFLVRTRFSPPEVDAVELQRLRGAEIERSRELQHDGVIVELWREAGTANAWGVWNAPDRVTLDLLVASLPCSPYMQIETWEIGVHPNRIPSKPEPRETETHHDRGTR